jgi:SAM-dependent methyltransferase
MICDAPNRPRRVWRTLAAAALLAAATPGLGARQPAPAQQTPAPAPARTHEQDVYQRFRAWATAQQSRADLIPRYRAKLAADGLAPAAIDDEIKIITDQGQRLEIDMWNRVLTNPNGRFNHEPNAFLVEMIKGRTPGTALDVGMGQGRNAVYLAKQGWTVTGFDPAAAAVALAERDAKAAGVTLKTATVRDDQFDFGSGRWDLIVLSYVDVRNNAERVVRALKPGGVVVVEVFHRDATKEAPIGGAVVFDNNELLRIFSGLRVLRYEDTAAVGDFGLQNTRVVRLCAEKY